MRLLRLILCIPVILAALAGGLVVAARAPNQFACLYQRGEQNNYLIDLRTGHAIPDDRWLIPRDALQSADRRYGAFTARTATGYTLKVSDYSARRTATIQPYLASMGGLTHGRNYAFSPDSRQIAVVFARTFSGQQAGLSRPYALTIANSDGSNLRRVLLNPRLGKLLLEPDTLIGWSADGRYVAFQVLEGVLDGNQAWNVYFYDAQTLEQFAVPAEFTRSGRGMVWSTVGSRFAGIALNPNRLLIIDPSSGIEHTFALPDNFPNFLLTWSPDGKYVAAEYTNTGFYGVFGMDGSVRVQPERDGTRVLGWSADSSALGLLRPDLEQGDILTYHVDSGAMSTRQANIRVGFPVTRIIGRKGHVLGITAQGGSLVADVIPFADQPIFRIAEGLQGKVTGLWSSDGGYVAVWWSGPTAVGIAWASADGTQKGHVTGLGHIKNLRWATDAAWFLYTAERQGQVVVGTVNTQTGKGAELPIPLPISLLAVEQAVADSPDGQALSLLADQAYVAFGRADETAIQVEGDVRFMPVWAADGSRVALLNGRQVQVYTATGQLVSQFAPYTVIPKRWDVTLTRCN